MVINSILYLSFLSCFTNRWVAEDDSIVNFPTVRMKRRMPVWVKRRRDYSWRLELPSLEEPFLRAHFYNDDKKRKKKNPPNWRDESKKWTPFWGHHKLTQLSYFIGTPHKDNRDKYTFFPWGPMNYPLNYIHFLWDPWIIPWILHDSSLPPFFYLCVYKM